MLLSSLVVPLAVSMLALEPTAPMPRPGTPELPLPPGARGDPLAPGPGEVEFTVDPELDRVVQRLLRAHGIELGHVIVLDPGSGEIFSYVSTDPRAFPPGSAYPAASLMKIVTAASALREAPDALARECRYLGSAYELGRAQLRPPSRGGRLDSFTRALALSNNQCFARLAVHELGARPLLGEMRRAGLLESPAPEHLSGWVEPVREPLDLGKLGSGLAGAFITPLAGARLAAALAYGELVEPHWVAATRDPDGRLRGPPIRGAPRRVWSQQIADRLRSQLVEVTERGTARHAFRRRGRPMLGPVRVSGKTGTLSGTRPAGAYSWFVGVAPADEPRVAIAALVVDAPVSASEVASDALREIFCDDTRCHAARAERLHGRARARQAALAREWARGGLDRGVRREPAPLDAVPRPIGAPRLDLPRRLLRHPVRGEILLRVDLSPLGEVLDVSIEQSDLPDFDAFVADAVRAWRFTPPTRSGVPVRASARLPIPIAVQ